MTTEEFLKFIGVFAGLQVLATMWLKARLEASIRHEYDRQIELFRVEQRRRERAAMIAELFAEWSANPPDLKRLNRLSFEASLWLPAEIVPELAKRLCNAADAKDIKQLLVDVRRHLTGQTDAVEPEHIVHFKPPPQDGAV